MTASNPLPAARAMDHRAERIDLAAAFRWFARLDMHESVANHLSLACLRVEVPHQPTRTALLAHLRERSVAPRRD